MDQREQNFLVAEFGSRVALQKEFGCIISGITKLQRNSSGVHLPEIDIGRTCPKSVMFVVIGDNVKKGIPRWAGIDRADNIAIPCNNIGMAIRGPADCDSI